jgi:hypothetical protein
MVHHYFLLYLEQLRRKIKQEATDALGIGNFHIHTVHLDIIKVFIHQLTHKRTLLKTILKFTLKLTLKQLLHVSV